MLRVTALFARLSYELHEDTVSKSLLVQMQTTLDPLTRGMSSFNFRILHRFSNSAYTITIGKTTNLSSVSLGADTIRRHENERNRAFTYPSAFQVPPDSALEPHEGLMSTLRW